MSSPVPDGQVRISSAEAIPLAYALTARIAADHGIRLIGIKGVALAHHGLRDPRTSADIDMLLHPDDKDRFVAAMEAAGWRVAADPSTPKILGFHSVDMLNDHWPMGLDLHTYFPGFLAPAGEVFDELWRRRTSIPQAGHEVFFTDLSSSAAIAALHHLRAIWRPEDEAAFARLVDKSTTRLSPDERADLVELSRTTGCVRPLGPYFSALDIEASPVHPAEQSEWERWSLGTQAHPYAAWWVRFRNLRPWQWPGFMWRALFLPTDELRAYHGDHTETTPLWRLHVHRVQRVLKAMPGALRHELDRRRRRS